MQKRISSAFWPVIGLTLMGMISIGLLGLGSPTVAADGAANGAINDAASQPGPAADTLIGSDVISNTVYLPALLTTNSSGSPTPTPTTPPPTATPDPTTPPSDDPLTTEERVSAVESMETGLNNVINTSVPFEQRNPVQELNDAAQEMLKAPNVATVLVYTETLTAQAVLVDGTSILLNNNRPPGAESDAGRSGSIWREQAAGTAPRLVADNVPTSRRYVSTSFDGGRSVASAVGSLLRGRGYAATGLGPSLADMQNYRNLGALYLDTHGTGWTQVDKISQNPNGSYTVKWGSPSYGLQSSTQVNFQTLNTTHKADLEAGRLVISLVEINGKYEAKLGITEKFISQYWDLKDAIVMIHSCFGGAGPFTGKGECYGNCANVPGTVFDPRPIRSAILGAGAKIIVSFDNYSNADIARNNILFFFDRLLGANEQQATSPPTRPFNFAEVWGEMSRRNLTTFNKPSWIGPFGITYGGNQVNMTFDAAPPDGSSTLLAPSIRTVDVIDDAGQSAGRVEITGDFGAQQGEVEVDGTLIPVVSWTKEKIVASPPWDGLGSRGYLVVKAPDEVRSNFIPFTEWRGTATLSYEPGLGSLKAEAEVDLRFRADLHEFRENINGTPKPRETQRAYFTGASTGQSSGSGTHTEEDAVTQFLGGGQLSIWSKSQVDGFANISRTMRAGEQFGTPVFGGFVDLNAQNRTARLCIFISGPYTTRVTGEEGTQDVPSFLAYVAGLGMEDSVQGLLSCYNLGMASDYSLPAGSRSVTLDEATFRIEWTQFTPFAEPTDRTPS